MKQPIYICPATSSELKLIIEKEEDGIIKEGFYENAELTKYNICDGIPDFTYPLKLSDSQQEQLRYYETHADVYDELQGLTFLIHNTEEDQIRKEMVSYLNLKPNSKVLELSCGTGRDSKNIASLLNENGELYLQDLSFSMLKRCKKNLQEASVPINYSVGNASYLAFPSDYFDALFSFGGLNVFDDLKRSLKEMARVVKPNGTIVVGDESLPEWLYHTEFGKILLNNNSLYKCKVPLDAIPIEAREVTIRYIIGGVYYLISFVVGEGEPVANFDIPIPGRRGGTLKTRYYGRLEGVSEEAKKAVLLAAEKRNMSVHQWLDELLKSAVEKENKFEGNG